VGMHLPIIESRADEGHAASQQRKIVHGFSSLSRSDLSDLVPKGLQDSARGFNPWKRVHAETRPEGAEGIRDRSVVWTISAYRKRRFYRPLRGGHRFNRHLGLKPQAQSFSPFGTQNRGDLQSNTPFLRTSRNRAQLVRRSPSSMSPPAEGRPGKRGTLHNSGSAKAEARGRRRLRIGR